MSYDVKTLLILRLKKACLDTVKVEHRSLPYTLSNGSK